MGTRPTGAEHVKRYATVRPFLPMLAAVVLFGPLRRCPAVARVERVICTGSRIPGYVGHEVAPGTEQAAVAPCPAGSEVVAVPLNRPRAVVPEPDDKVSDDPHGAIGMVTRSAPP